MDAAGLAILAGLSAAAYYGLVSPTLRRHEQAGAQALELRSEQTKARDLERSLRSITDRLDATQRQLQAAHFALEPASRLNDRLAELTELAGANQIQVDTIESGALTALERYSTIAIRISGRGSYRSCAAMLSQMRTTMRDVGVVTMQLGSSGGTTDINASFTLDLLWYTQPQPKPAVR
jgi:Tfp pilus assembly protein PilO